MDETGAVPPASIAELRRLTIEVLDSVCAPLCDYSAALAAQAYDQFREQQIGQSFGAVADSRRSEDATRRWVWDEVGNCTDPVNAKTFARRMSARADYEIKRASGDCMLYNGTLDSRSVRFARVPSGAETCAFCVMLASRGAVYHSAESAGEHAHFHPSCDCRIVPVFGSENWARPPVEGYDVDALYGRYLKSVEDGRLNVKNVKKFSTSSAAKSETAPKFESVGDIEKYLLASTDLQDAEVRFAICQDGLKALGFNARQIKKYQQSIQLAAREVVARFRA